MENKHLSLRDHLHALLYVDNCLPDDPDGWLYNLEHAILAGLGVGLVQPNRQRRWGGDVGILLEAACGGGKSAVLSALRTAAANRVTSFDTVSVTMLSFAKLSSSTLKRFFDQAIKNYKTHKPRSKQTHTFFSTHNLFTRLYEQQSYATVETSRLQFSTHSCSASNIPKVPTSFS